MITETTTKQEQAISAECASGRHWQGWVLGHCDGTRYNYKAMAKDGPCTCQCHAEVSK